ncbi:hypothetical protein B0G75_102137 [Paraburkholderia sp. BL18I3N2]|uniref:hypothetical protein n=1 Tax=Paraburkholderia sp. BL18I3N2 TaxID=1938799 RepID=UPI000D07F46F|nr:hypothetical protein [Paraburkholderia sp. BL18I3N2]PRX34108.1 hypothetical protein B0G75_102137 [Paraburkholderia sp. BL18I3N2]
MIDFVGRLSWLLFNVGVPVCAPFALLPLLSFSRFYRQSSNGIAIRSVQNGQLLWVVISMCASACYEIGSALGDASTTSRLAFMLAGLLWHVLFLVVASILVSFGAADSTPHPDYRHGDEARERKLMWTSTIMTAAVAASFALSHYSLN